MLINPLSSPISTHIHASISPHHPKHLLKRPKASHHLSSALQLSAKKKKQPSITPQKKKLKEDPEVNLLASELFAKALIAHLEKPLFESQAQSIDCVVLAEKLFEKLSHETKKGISTTTLMLQDPMSYGLLHQTQITLIHYDTAPHSFNIHIETTPHAIEYFSQHLPNLSRLLSSALPECEFHFEPLKILSYKSKLDQKKNAFISLSDKKTSQEIETLDY